MGVIPWGFESPLRHHRERRPVLAVERPSDRRRPPQAGETRNLQRSHATRLRTATLLRKARYGEFRFRRGLNLPATVPRSARRTMVISTRMPYAGRDARNSAASLAASAPLAMAPFTMGERR